MSSLMEGETSLLCFKICSSTSQSVLLLSNFFSLGDVWLCCFQYWCIHELESWEHFFEGLCGHRNWGNECLCWSRSWRMKEGFGVNFWCVRSRVLMQSQIRILFELLSVLFSRVKKSPSFFRRATFSLYVSLITTFKAPQFFPHYLHFKYHVLTHEYSVRDVSDIRRCRLDNSHDALPEPILKEERVTWKIWNFASRLNKRSAITYTASISNSTSTT